MNEVYLPTVDVPCKFDDGTELTVRIKFAPPSYLEVVGQDDQIVLAGKKAARKFLKSKGVEKPGEFRPSDDPDLADEATIVSNRAQQLCRLQWIAGRLRGWNLKERHDPELTRSIGWEALADAGPIVFLAIQSTVCGYSQGKRCEDDKKKSESPPESASSNPTSDEAA